MLTLMDIHAKEEQKCQLGITPKPLCSLNLIQNYLKTCGYFPSKGLWNNEITHYDPGFCTLPRSEHFHHHMSHSLVSNNISRILIIGDSNGARYSNALQSGLQNIGYQCKVVKSEQMGFFPDKKYYLRDMGLDPSVLEMKERTCQSCTSKKIECVPKNSHGNLKRLIMEYVSMMVITTDSIVPNKSYCATNWHPVCNISTQQEFLFRAYLKDNYPQLIVIASTFAHDWDKSFDFVWNGLEDIVDLVEDTAPSNTQVVWLPMTAINMPIYVNKIVDQPQFLKIYEGFNYEDRVHALNHLLYHVVGKHFTQSKEKVLWYPFFDLYRMSKQKQSQLAKDGVHFKPKWYNYIIGYLFAMIDNNVTP